MDCSCWSLTQGTRGRQPGPRLEEASMPLANSYVLISGAGVAGPTLAYWLARYGFTPTVIERTPALRAGLGGHAVDLFGPAVDVVEWMGILPKVQAARTRTDLLVFERPGRAPVAVELSRLVAGVATRHVEIIRGKVAAMYPVRQTGEARAVLLFRAAEEAAYDHRDLDQQRRLLREAFAAPVWELPRLLAELEGASDFYFDSISQIHMPSWSNGRVTLVGDAGYCPGPAVGGGTAVAVVGAYVLAGAL